MTESQKKFAKAVKMAKRFTGDWIARMKLALKIVWKAANKTVNELAEIINKKFASVEHVSCRAWEKYGKHRIYVNYYFTKLGMFDFDENGQLIGHRDEFSAVDGGDHIAAYWEVLQDLKANKI